MLCCFNAFLSIRSWAFYIKTNKLLLRHRKAVNNKMAVLAMCAKKYTCTGQALCVKALKDLHCFCIRITTIWNYNDILTFTCWIAVSNGNSSSICRSKWHREIRCSWCWAIFRSFYNIFVFFLFLVLFFLIIRNRWCLLVFIWNDCNRCFWNFIVWIIMCDFWWNNVFRRDDIFWWLIFIKCYFCIVFIRMMLWRTTWISFSYWMCDMWFFSFFLFI